MNMQLVSQKQLTESMFEMRFERVRRAQLKMVGAGSTLGGLRGGHEGGGTKSLPVRWEEPVTLTEHRWRWETWP